MLPNISASSWQPIHGAEVRLVDEKLIFRDSAVLDWHLIRVVDREIANKRVTLQVVYEPLADGEANFYVNGWGGIDLAIVARDGTLLKSDALDASVRKDEGLFHLTVVYNSGHPSISIGTATHQGVYRGHGQDQVAVHAVSFHLEPLRQAPERVRALTLLDIGAAGGLQPQWLPHLDVLDVTMVEPSQREAASLRVHFPDFRIIEQALFNEAGVQELKVTRFPECSSLMEPNMAQLTRYRAAPLFEVIDRVGIHCERYDHLHSSGLVPAPDVIKLDVQGAEYEVLQGFGAMLADCIAIELEGHFYEVYKDQRLIGDLIDYLAGFDLRLRRMEPQRSFDSDLVEVNAFFTKPRSALTADRLWKLDLVEQVWKLSVSDSVLDVLKKFDSNRP